MSWKMADTESSAKTLWIVSARMSATVRHRSRAPAVVSGSIGTVSVTMTLVEGAFLDPLDRRRREDAVRRAGVDLPRAALLQELRRRRRACLAVSTMSSVITAHLPSTSPMTFVTARDVVRRPILLQDGQVAADHLGELARQSRAAGVGRRPRRDSSAD